MDDNFAHTAHDWTPLRDAYSLGHAYLAPIRGFRKLNSYELIDWVKVLKRYSEEEALAKLEGQLPFPEVLLKSWEDHLRYLGERGS